MCIGFLKVEVEVWLCVCVVVIFVVCVGRDEDEEVIIDGVVLVGIEGDDVFRSVGELSVVERVDLSDGEFIVIVIWIFGVCVGLVEV